MPKQFRGNLGRGMNTRTSPFVAQPGELILARNANFDQVGSIGKRFGYGTGWTIVANKKILGASEYSTSATNYYLLVITNNSADTYAKLSYIPTGPTVYDHPDANTQSLLANVDYEFANFLDASFIVGGHDQQIFTITGILNGDYSDSRFTTGAPNAKYIIQSHNRIFLVNTSNGENEIFWSDLPTGTPGDWTLTWTSTNNTLVETNDGESLAGVGKNFNRVLLFKPSSIHKWDPDSEELVKEDGRIGCTSHRSIKNIGSSTIFYKERYGFYDYQQGEPQLISRKIDDWIAAIPQGTMPAAETDERHYLATVGSMTMNGRNYEGITFDYDYLLKSWSILDNIDGSVIVRYGSGNAKSFYFGNKTTGVVHDMFSYTYTTTSTSTSSTSSTSISTSSTSISTSSTSSTTRSTSSTSSTTRSTSSTSHT
jgi:hypothetical protein